jgi:hypothetical protein
MRSRRLNPRDVARCREYLEGRGVDCDGMPDGEIVRQAGMGARQEINEKRTADRIDGFDRDDLGESPDF